MPLALCAITGTVYNAPGVPLAGIPVFVHRVLKSGTLIHSDYSILDTSDANGVVSFTLPRASTAYLSASAEGLNADLEDGTAFTIPDTATATLEGLVSVSQVPAEGLTVQSSGTPLAELIGTFNFVGFTVELTGTGVARITASASVTDEQVQDALATFFPDAAPYDWTYDDVGNRVSLVIAPATTAVNGLLSAADKTLLDALGPRNAANGYAGLSATGLLTESQIPSSIARDSETTAAIDAEAATRAAADALKADLISPSFTAPSLGVASATSLRIGTGANLTSAADGSLMVSNNAASSQLQLDGNGLSLMNGGDLALRPQQDAWLSHSATATLRLGRTAAASPVAQTLSVQNVVTGTSNTAGANFTIAGSQGTGTGVGGSLIFQVAAAGGSGTAVNALATALTIDSTKAATFTGPVNPGVYTVATLPTGIEGMIARVSDGDAGLAWGATVVNTGAGATKYLVWFNGTNWTVVGK